MPQLIGAVAAGLLVAGLVVYLLSRPRKGAAPGPVSGPTGLGWASLVLAILTLAAAAIGFLAAPTTPTPEVETPRQGFDPQSLLLIALVTGIAAIVTATLALRRGDRHWPAWAGLLIGGAAAGGWVGVIVFIMFNPY